MRFSNLLLLLSVFLIIFSFWPLVFYNLVTDDFFLLWISKFDSLGEFLSFFTFSHSFSAEFAFYRPLTIQVYYSLINHFFGLDPTAYHIASLGLHIINTLLVYKLANIFLASRSFSVIAALLFGLNPSQTMAIGWAANFQEVGVTFFIILATLTFHTSLRKRGWKFFSLFMYLSSITFFTLALASKQGAMIFPFVLIVMILLFGRRKDLLKTIPFFIILLFYTYFHFVKYHFEQTESYTFILDSQVFNTLRWHIWWALGFPEPFTTFIGPKLRVLNQLWISFFKEGIIVFSLFIIINLALVLEIFAIIRKKFVEIFDRRILFFSLFYFLFLASIFQQKHFQQSLCKSSLFSRGFQRLLFCSLLLFLSVLFFFLQNKTHQFLFLHLIYLLLYCNIPQSIF